MEKKPIVFTSTHPVVFSDLDPYKHMRSDRYATYFLNNRMLGLNKYLGWDQKALETSPFMVWIRRLEIDYLRPVWGDREITVTSYVSKFEGVDAYIECAMTDGGEITYSKCLMIVAHIDRATNRSCEWPEDRKALFYE